MLLQDCEACGSKTGTVMAVLFIFFAVLSLFLWRRMDKTQKDVVALVTYGGSIIEGVIARNWNTGSETGSDALRHAFGKKPELVELSRLSCN